MTFYGNDSFGGIANKTQNFEVVAQYQFDDFNLPLRPSVAYLQSKGKISTPILATATRIWSSMSTWA